MVHGGAFVMGSKTSVEDWYSSYFLSQGFVVVAPNYRLVTLSGETYTNQFPVPVDDVAAATQWIVTNAATYHANPNEIVMLGTSAGAQIAGMITFDPTGFNNWGLATPLHIAGFIGDSGTYDWPVVITGGMAYDIKNYLGSYYGAPQWDPTEPITFASASSPPSLIIDGTNDNLTNYQNSTDFVNALQGAGATVTYQLYTGYGHTHFSQIFATNTAEQQVVTTYLQSIGL
jgi:acetyl esterase/lipase